MKRVVILLGLGLAGCQSGSEQGLLAAGALVGNLAVSYECAQLPPDVALQQLCRAAGGELITAGEAQVRGLLASKRVKKG